jgi:Fe-S-cluster-containing dehydrogenase component/formate-dependent nitrite reductase membrane component NrfD
MTYGFIIDNRKCIGCHACTVACKAEHETPLGVNRTWVKYIEKGSFPNTRRAFSVMRCNHCANAPCVAICPVTALFTRKDGIVDFDPRRCIGCKACLQACPYDALHIDPLSHTAAKCNYCAHRVEIGLEPPCVNVCPTHAIISGDLDDPQSEIAVLLARQPVQVRKPEKGTEPKLFYIEADEASLSPGATSSEGSFMWSDPPPQGVDPSAWRAALSQHLQEQAAYEMKHAGAKKVYAAPEPHRGSWGRSVSGYLFTKSIASGAFMVFAALFAFRPRFDVASFLPTSLLSLVALALTGFLLVFKLERRERFLWVLTRPQWRSWLTRGAYLMTAYGALLSLLVGMHLAGIAVPGFLVLLTVIAAVGTALYSAFLFNQAKGRDLWQSPVLPLHLLAQSVVAGAAILALTSFLWRGLEDASGVLLRILAGGLALNLLALGAEFLSRHATEDAEAAAALIVHGRYRHRFWWGVFAAGHLLPIALLTQGLLGPAALAALAGLFLFEDLFVEAGQAIPLA